ncbi:MAG: DUF2488 family protein [Prochlorococcus sp.]|nr:DUF2488 family protein [Prochlorococcus sp.]
MFPLPTGASAATALVSTNQDFSLFLKLRMECVLQQVFEAPTGSSPDSLVSNAADNPANESA